MATQTLINARISFFGVISALYANTINVPFLGVDTSPKTSNETPIIGTYHDDLLKAVNLKVGSANELSSVTVGANLDTQNIEVNLDIFKNFTTDDSDEQDKWDSINDALKSYVVAYADGIRLDENNRVSYLSFIPNEELEITFGGDIYFKDDTSMKLDLKLVGLKKANGTYVQLALEPTTA